jgi:hypothetical protein
MNTIIKTLPQLQQTQADTWVYGLIVAGVALLLAIIIAQLIPWRSNRQDYMSRRICFIVIGLVMPVSYWLYNMQSVVPRIQNPGFQDMFKGTNLNVLIVSIVLYTIVGVALMFVFRNSKFGSILGKKKN